MAIAVAEKMGFFNPTAVATFLGNNLGFNMLFKLGSIFIHRHNVKNQSLTSIVQTLN